MATTAAVISGPIPSPGMSVAGIGLAGLGVGFDPDFGIGFGMACPASSGVMTAA
jgi:hypothetical protein